MAPSGKVVGSSGNSNIKEWAVRVDLREETSEIENLKRFSQKIAEYLFVSAEKPV